MAAGRINVTPQEMINTAGQLEGDISNFKTSVDKIYQHHSEMDAMWDGDANNAFNAIFLEDRQKFNRLLQMMDEYAKAVKLTAERYIACENTAKQIVTQR